MLRDELTLSPNQARRSLAEERSTSGGFSLLELMVVIGIGLVLAAVAIPSISALRSYNVRNDARSIAGQLLLSRMRAGAGFTRVKLSCTVSTGTCLMYTQQNGDALDSWTAEATGGTLNLSSGVKFGIPSAAIRGAGGQSVVTPQQGSKDVTATTGKIEVTFNSRGLPIDPTNSSSKLVTDYVIYLLDSKNRSFAVSIDGGGRPLIYTFQGSGFTLVKD